MAKDKAKKASLKIVDMTNVKEGGGTFKKTKVPAGDYLARILKVQDAEVKSGENKGRFQWLFTIGLEKYPTAKYPYYCQLEENQLWKVRNLLLAAGKNVPKKKLKLDPESIVGKLIAVTMEDDEYEGKVQSSVAAVFPPSELDGGSADGDEDEPDPDEDTEEAKPAKKAKKAKKDKKGDEETKKEKPAKDKAAKPEKEAPKNQEPAKKAKKAAPKKAEPKKTGKAGKRKVSDAELEELDIEGL